MGWLANLLTVCPGAAYRPAQPRQIRFVLKNPFRQRTSANISKANHQDFHGRKDMELRLRS